MTKFRKKHDTEWVCLAKILADSWEDPNDAQNRLIANLTGIELELEHLGPETAETWGLRANSLRLEDMARVFDLQRKFTRDQMPTLYMTDDNGNIRAGTSEGRADQVKMARDVVREAVKGVRGDHALAAPLVGENDRSVLADEIVRWGIGVEVMEAAISFQALAAEEIFTEGVGDVEAR